MKEKNKLLLIVVLIGFYFISIFINTNHFSNYIIYSDSIYQIKSNKTLKQIPFKVINKKIKLVDKKFNIDKGYYKQDNSGNSRFSFYDNKYNNLRKEKYYYGYTNKLKIVKFNDKSNLNDTDIKNINKLLSNSSINIDIAKQNYYKVVSFDNKKLIFIGNFYDNNYYGKSVSDLSEDKYYEFIILKDNNSYSIVKKIEVPKEEFLQTDFLLFDCVLKTDDYYIGLGQINYSFFDSASRSLFKLSKNKLG